MPDTNLLDIWSRLQQDPDYQKLSPSDREYVGRMWLSRAQKAGALPKDAGARQSIIATVRGIGQTREPEQVTNPFAALGRSYQDELLENTPSGNLLRAGERATGNAGNTGDTFDVGDGWLNQGAAVLGRVGAQMSDPLLGALMLTGAGEAGDAARLAGPLDWQSVQTAARLAAPGAAKAGGLNAAIQGTSSAASQYADTGSVDWGRVGGDAATAGVLGALLGGAGAAAARLPVTSLDRALGLAGERPGARTPSAPTSEPPAAPGSTVVDTSQPAGPTHLLLDGDRAVPVRVLGYEPRNQRPLPDWDASKWDGSDLPQTDPARVEAARGARLVLETEDGQRMTVPGSSNLVPFQDRLQQLGEVAARSVDAAPAYEPAQRAGVPAETLPIEALMPMTHEDILEALMGKSPQPEPWQPTPGGAMPARGPAKPRQLAAPDQPLMLPAPRSGPIIPSDGSVVEAGAVPGAPAALPERAQVNVPREGFTAEHLGQQVGGHPPSSPPSPFEVKQLRQTLQAQIDVYDKNLAGTKLKPAQRNQVQAARDQLAKQMQEVESQLPAEARVPAAPATEASTPALPRGARPGFIKPTLVLDALADHVGDLVDRVSGAGGVASEVDVAKHLPVAETRVARLQEMYDGAVNGGDRRAAALLGEDLRRARAQLDQLRTATAGTREKATATAADVVADPPTHDGESHAGSINLDRLNTTDDVKGLFQAVTERYKGEIDSARRGVQSHEETRRLADEMGMSVDQLLARRKGEAFNAEQALAARDIVKTSGEELQRQARGIAAGDNSDEAVLAFTRQLELHAQIQAQVSGVASEAGRALNSFNILARESKARLRELQGMVESLGGRDRLGEVADLIAGMDDPAEVNRFARDAQRKNFGDMLTEYYMNSILSVPNTHLAYTIGNLTGVVGKVADTATAAGIGRIRQALGGQGERVSVGEARSQAFAVMQGAREGLDLAIKAWREERAPFETVDHGHAIPGPLGTAIRLPIRAIVAKDAFVKGIFYRMELNGLAYRQALREGLTGGAFDRKVGELVSNPTDELMQAAKNDAERQTFTNRLAETQGFLARGGQHLQALKHDPALGIVGRTVLNLLVPFVKLPVNVVLGSIARSPAALVTAEFHAAMKRGGPEADLALARVALGTTIAATFFGYARQGGITGGGPSDPARQKLMRADGWQPYSFKLGDSYYAYNKLGALGLLIGMAADVAEAGMYPDPRKQEGAGDLLVKTVGGLVKNLANESWLQGVKSVIDAIEDPDHKLRTFLSGEAQGFVPYSGLMGRLATAVDPTVRAYSNPLEAMEAKVPVLSERLPAKQDPLGRPVAKDVSGVEAAAAPFLRTQAKHDPVLEELGRLDVSPGNVAKQIALARTDVPLTEDQQRLLAATRGEMITRILGPLVASPGYQRLTDSQKEHVLRTYLDRASELAHKQFIGQNRDAVVQQYKDAVKARAAS